MGLTLAMCVTPDARHNFLHVVEDYDMLCERNTDWAVEIYPSPITLLNAVIDYVDAKTWDSRVGLRIVINTSKVNGETTLTRIREALDVIELETMVAEENAIDDLISKHDLLDEMEDDSETNPFYGWPEPRYGGGE